jgi:hypothetical protein
MDRFQMGDAGEAVVHREIHWVPSGQCCELFENKDGGGEVKAKAELAAV